MSPLTPSIGTVTHVFPAIKHLYMLPGTLARLPTSNPAYFPARAHRSSNTFPSMSSEEMDNHSPSLNRSLSCLKPKQSEKHDSACITSTSDPITTIDVKVAKPVEDDPNPVSFSGLFRSVFISVPFHLRFLHRPSPRFSTRTEVIFNALTLISAVAAGAALVS